MRSSHDDLRDLQDLLAAGLSRGMSVVDFGCGTGAFAREIARTVGPPGSVIGIDASAFSIARARELAAEEGVTNTFFEVADERSLPFPSDSVDICVTRHLFARVTRPEEVLKEMVRLTVPGGLVVAVEEDDGLWVCEPEPPALTELRGFLARRRLSGGGGALGGRGLYRLLRAAGLERVRVVARPVNSTELPVPAGAGGFRALSALTRTVEAMAEAGELTPEKAARYTRAIDEVAADAMSFHFVCDFFAYARKPLRCA